MQRLTVCVPESGRVTVRGVPSTSQVAFVSRPSKSTSSGTEMAAVVGSTTVMLLLAAIGCEGLSAMTSSEASNGTTTNGTGLERGAGAPGLEICRVKVAAVCRSAGVSAIAQMVAVEHVVGRATPLRRIVEPVPALPGTKFNPCIDRGKPSIAPAIALEGRITSMVGPDVMAIVAEADFVLSAWLVAMIEIALGEGLLWVR